MKNFLVLAHPDGHSFLSSLYEEVARHLSEKGEEIIRTDLYHEGFTPLLYKDEMSKGFSSDDSVMDQQRFLTSCDRLLLFYPDWWGMPPAILKGWLDRVLAADTAFSWEGDDFLEKEWMPLLTGKRAELFICGDGDLNYQWLSRLWNNRILGKCGMSVNLRLMDNIRSRSYGEIRQWVEEQKSSL